MTEWDAAYTHSETAGGNSVHVSTDENTAWDEAKAHSIVTSGNPHAISGADLTLSSSDISDVDATSYKRFIRPGEGWYSAEVYHTTLSSSMKFGSGVTHQWDVTTQVPIDVTAVAAIKLHYYSQSTGNLWLKFQSYLWDTDTLGSYVTTDETDASSAYAGEGIGNALGVVIVPSGAYDGLGSLNEGDIFGFHVTRFGGDENDTFEQD